MLAFDNTSSIICYSNGSYRTHGAGNEYDEDLFPSGKSHSPTFLTINFKRDSYFADIGNEDYFDFRERNLHIAMKVMMRESYESRDENKKKEGSFITWAAMGKGEDSYFLSFHDGRTFWNNLPDKLEESLRKARIQGLSIKRVCLSTFDDRYLLLYDNGNIEYQYCCSNSMQTLVTKKR